RCPRASGGDRQRKELESLWTWQRLLRRQWYCGFDCRTGARVTDERETPAKARRPLPHREETEVLAGFGRRVTLLGNAPAAVIGDRPPDAILLELKRDVD